MMQCKQPQWEMSDTSYQELLSIKGDPTVKIQIIAGHSSLQSIDFNGATPTTGFTLRFLSQVVSNSFDITPEKKWVEGFGFHLWELESDPSPSTACSHPPFLLLHQNKPSITSRWSFLESRGGNDWNWAFAEQLPLKVNKFWLQQWDLLHLV